MDNDIPVAVLDPAKVYSSLSEYCAEKRISPATYYRRVKAGKGPRTVKIGVMRAILREQPKGEKSWPHNAGPALGKKTSTTQARDE